MTKDKDPQVMNYVAAPQQRPKHKPLPDNVAEEIPEWTEEDFARVRPAAETHPELVEAYRRSRGKQKSPTKVQVTMRLDSDLVETLKATGRGWQTRANDTLRKALGLADRADTSNE